MTRTAQQPAASEPISMNIADIRQALSEGIRSLRDGKATPASINALSNATGKILSSVRLEMEYHKLIGTTPDIDVMSTGKRLNGRR